MRAVLAGAAVAALVALGVTILPGMAAAAPYANCTEARDAGATNIPSSSPKYQPKLDADKDGYGCDDGTEGSSAGMNSGSSQVSEVPRGPVNAGDGSTR